VIAEIKKASPSKVYCVRSFDPRPIAQSYENTAALPVWSVLNRCGFFSGFMNDYLRAAMKLPCNLPCQFAKDFLIDPVSGSRSPKRWVADCNFWLIVLALDDG